MGLHLPRYLATGAACALLSAAGLVGAVASASASGTGATGGAARARSVNPNAAARACAGQRGATGPMSNATPGYLAGLVSCVLRNERGQLALTYTRDRAISQMIATSLRRFVALPYLPDRQAALHAEGLAASNIGRAVCPSTRPGSTQDEWAFADITPPANASPLQVAKLLAGEFEAAGSAARAAGAVFGVAARSGLLFEPDQPDGASFGVVAVVCS
ncbi:MAG TPA: hypothetical protein VEF89_20565 [Solirubrobacteraceae bacterium]|nr:hypothetical protein [Solirubrobacteraceae bacterium]